MKIFYLFSIQIILLTCLGNAQTVQIGDQIWMSKNLDIDTFRNGDMIPEAKTKEEWRKAYSEKKPAWCYYNNDTANGNKYGRLYNWFAVTDPRGLAPQGWHIPHVSEWFEFYSFLGGKKGKIAGKLKSITGWEKEGNGDNSTGFNALPAGTRNGSTVIKPNNGFAWMGSLTIWWGIEEPTCYNPRDACLGVRCFVIRSKGKARIEWHEIRDGYSVRCVQD